MQPPGAIVNSLTPVRRRIARLRSSSIHLAAVLTILLGISTLVMLYFMQLASETVKRQTLAAAIEAEVDSIVTMHAMHGVDGVKDILRHKMEQQKTGAYYALMKDKAIVFGSIPAVPAHVNMQVTQDFTMATDDVRADSDANMRQVYARCKPLGEEYSLIVGRNVGLSASDTTFIDRIGLAVIALLIALAAAGFFIGERVVYRINLIADTASDIMQTSDLSRRIPVMNQWDDLSKLADILNQMIARIETLMTNVRQVSDNVAHDLRTPLTRIRNRLEMLQDRSEDEQLGIEQDTQSLIDEADRLLETFAALLRISNIESGKWRASAEQVAMDKVMLDVIEFYEPVAMDKGQVLHTNIQTAHCCGDKHLLFQACANLVDNAVKYAPSDGMIEVSLSADDAMLVMTITNDGSTALDNDEAQQMFRRFYRSDAARTSHQGNGLGLSLTKAIILQHRGSIKAETRDGRFTVTVTLPRVCEETGAALS